MPRTQTTVRGLAGRLFGGAELKKQPAVTAETISERPTRAEVVSSMLVEANIRRGDYGRPFDRDQCESALRSIEKIAKWCRNHRYARYLPTDAEMETTDYTIVNLLLPHGQAPAVDSAADKIGRYVLKPERGETSFWHDQDQDPLSGTYCTFGITVEHI